MGKHIDLDIRSEIQTGLKEKKTFAEIAIGIGKSTSTVSREVYRNRYFVHHDNVATLQTKNVCTKRFTCNIKENCKSKACFRRNKNCKLCGMCNNNCDTFEEEVCGKYDQAPFVCNGCAKKPRCPLSKWLYDARKANEKYREKLSDSRKGISLDDAELKCLDGIVSPLLKKGQSVRYICSHKGEEIAVSDKTIYKYIEQGLLNADLFDLKRRVQRRSRKKAGPPKLVDRKCRADRTYDDYKLYMSEHPDTAVVQMDTVEGRRGGKVILTLLFTNCNLQLGFLRDHNDAASVTKIFDELRETLDDKEFIKLFPVILVDRGSEFSDPKKIEVDFKTGEIQSRVFYCDPQNTNQKSHCEKNHEHIREVVPKGRSLDTYIQDDIITMMNHINSYGREKYNFKSPLDLFESIYGTKIVKKLGIKRIPANAICLTPKLLKK